MSYSEMIAISDNLKQKERNRWEQLRMQCYYSVYPHLKQNTRPSDIIPLPWDKTIVKKKSPEEQMKLFHEATKGRFKNKK